MKKIFISQEVLDSLFADNKAELNGDCLVIHARSDQVYTITAAFKFVTVADGTPDANGLVGKIYTQEELTKIKADIYMDSAIVNDLAYTIEPGFVGVSNEPAQPPAAALPAGPAAAAPSAADAAQEAAAAETAENDQLADYLLKIL
jgi:hypothetical protein